MNVLYIVGNRPQFVKLAVLHQEMAKHTFINESIIHTGQHFSDQMSDVFFRDLGIDLPTVNLNIHSLSHIALIAQTMEALEKEIPKVNPDVIVVFGDTNATLAGALTGKKLGIPVAHIEAGIRTFDETMPEESNRYLSDRIATINFCCTRLNEMQLKKEGFMKSIPSKVIFSGDLMLDAYLYYKIHFGKSTKVLDDNGLVKNQYLLATIHRRQNIEDLSTLQNIIFSLNQIHKHIPVVCPLHPNTKRVLENNAITCEFKTIPPQSYFAMQTLLQNSSHVITDSGGVQREAFFAKKPLVIIMERPFWPEVTKYGGAVYCSGRGNELQQAFEKIKGLTIKNRTSVFGKGNAATIISNELISLFKKRDL
jgi:UDP-GlcNAc3NAcA epimerase